MKVTILKGTNQIGGCITEIKSDKGTKILIDYGKDLEETEEVYYPEINWNEYEAVFITHIHDDHIGLINQVPENVKVYVEEVSYELYKIYKEYVDKETAKKVETFKLGSAPIEIGDLIIHPYKVDHSAFNSVMYLIEGDGKRVLHLGDFRTNGRAGVEFEPTLQKIKKVNMLIMEGTTLSREDKYDENGNLIYNDTEDELCEKIKEVMKQYKNVLILQSSLNIDRIITMYNAAESTNKTLVEDVFTAIIAAKLENYDDNDYHVPNSINKKYNVRVYVPGNRDKKEGKEFKTEYDEYLYEKYIKDLKDQWIYKDLKYEDKPVAIMVKTSWNSKYDYLNNELHKFKEWGLLNDCCLIYSMWEGYKDKEGNSTKTFVEQLKNDYNIPIISMHTSGHADKKARDILLNSIEYNQLLPIHTTEKEKYRDIPKAVIIEDGEEIIVE